MQSLFKVEHVARGYIIIWRRAKLPKSARASLVGDATQQPHATSWFRPPFTLPPIATTSTCEEHRGRAFEIALGKMLRKRDVASRSRTVILSPGPGRGPQAGLFLLQRTSWDGISRWRSMPA